MKKTISCAVLPFLLLNLLFAGCSATEQVETTAPTSTTSYTLTHVESGIISYTADEFDAVGTLELQSDGTARLNYGGRETELIYDESNMWSADNETELHPYHISGLVLTLDYFSETLTFIQTGDAVTFVEK